MALLEKMATEKKTIQEILEIKPSLLEEIYAMAYGYYESGKYKESASLFQLLIGIAPKNYKFLFGFGASYYQLGDFDAAILAFYAAVQREPHPESAYYLALIHTKLGQTQEALLAVEMALEYAKNKEEHRSIRERCLLIKKTLS